MKLEEIPELEIVYVFKGRHRAGTLKRTTKGSIFEYDDLYLQRAADGRLGALALSLPLAEKTHLTLGDNLHPFFAGLLPEGRRLSVLISLVKTSADDLFSLLVASGIDCIGDVFVSPEPELSEGFSNIPVTELGSASFADLFEQSLSAGEYDERKYELTASGIQPKISAERISFPVSIAKKKKLYILKLAAEQFPRLVENEHFFMEVAASCGILTAKTKIVHDRSGTSGLLVERFDRVWHDGTFERIHQEDACQFLSRYPHDKYRISMREVAGGIERFTTSPIIEAARLLELKAFSYLIANGDLHAKNISLVHEPRSGRVILSPAYDLVSTLPYGDQTMALALEGKKKNLRAKDFIVWGKRLGVREVAARSILQKLVKNVIPFIGRLEEIALDNKKTAFLRRTMEERIEQLTVEP